ncbi:MAG: DUF72 domain-containing protein [Anaerolineales bacterium]|nr:DUF72 domain-containing protein [Anaerolineales bacterium]
MDWYVGTMGFAYEPWRNGVFYPAGMPQKQFLGYYSQRFNAVEMDSTFYGLPSAKTVQNWTAVTEPGFKISPKTPRAITHDLRLDDSAAQMATFLDTMRLLEDKLGAILIQFPPDFTVGAAQRVDHFLGQLPADLRYAVEFRHRSWDTPETAQMLAAHNTAWVMTDYLYMPARITYRTADFLYLRFLGRHGQYPDKDREVEDKTAVLQNWRAQVETHLEAIDTVYAFFNDDYAGYAPATANKFKKIVGMNVEEIRPYQQGRLF